MFRLDEGILDRGIRLVLGLVLVGFIFTVLTGVYQIITTVVAAILLLTGIVGFCPLYVLFGINTRRSDQRELHAAP